MRKFLKMAGQIAVKRAKTYENQQKRALSYISQHKPTKTDYLGAPYTPLRKWCDVEIKIVNCRGFFSGLAEYFLVGWRCEVGMGVGDLI